MASPFLSRTTSRARCRGMTLLVLSTPFIMGLSSRAMAKVANLQAMEKPMELHRFMGSWYVLAHIPVKLVKEHLAHNAVETYSWDEAKQRIDVHYRFNEDAHDGPLNDSYQRGWVQNKDTNAEWRVSPKLPLFGYALSGVLRLPYIIVDRSEDYSTAIIGYPNRAYLWVLSRRPEVSSKEYEKLIDKCKSFGYDESKIRRVPQMPGKTFESPN